VLQLTDTGRWHPAEARCLTLWAMDELKMTGDVVVAVLPRAARALGRARYAPQEYGRVRQVRVHVQPDDRYSWPYMPLDPRCKTLHAWLEAHPATPLQDVRELFLFTLGHELWHTLDPWSATRRIERKSPEFHLMEQRCDEAGLRLVLASREQRPELMSRVAAEMEAHDAEMARRQQGVRDAALESGATTRLGLLAELVKRARER
jgi:hypothetical protein